MSMLRIKYELISRGISQTEFAKSAGLKPQAVSRIVNGLEPPYTKRGERIAAALGWEGDPSELFEEVTMYAKPTTLGQLQADNAKLREQMERLVTLLRADCDIEASWDGLRKFWSIGLTEDGCLMRDRACKAEAENAKLRLLVRDMYKSMNISCQFSHAIPAGTMAHIKNRVIGLGVEVDE